MFFSQPETKPRRTRGAFLTYFSALRLNVNALVAALTSVPVKKNTNRQTPKAKHTNHPFPLSLSFRIIARLKISSARIQQVSARQADATFEYPVVENRRFSAKPRDRITSNSVIPIIIRISGLPHLTTITLTLSNAPLFFFLSYLQVERQVPRTRIIPRKCNFPPLSKVYSRQFT